MQDLINKYIYNSEQGVFPNSQPFPVSGPEMADFASQMAVGLNSQPVSLKDVLTARSLMRKTQNPQGLGMADTDTLMKLVKDNLKIPVQRRNRMSDVDLLKEITTLAQKPRKLYENIEKINPSDAIQSAKKQVATFGEKHRFTGSKPTQASKGVTSDFNFNIRNLLKQNR